MVRNLKLIVAGVAVLLAQSVGSAFPIVMDQIGPDPSFTAATTPIFASQDFEAANNAFDIAAIDDFTVPAGPALQATTVEAVIGGFGNPIGWPGATTDFRVEFYTSIASGAANLTGDAGTCTIPAGAAAIVPWGAVGTQNRQKVTVDVSSCNIMLAGGTQYWLAVIPVQPFAGAGQTGVAEMLDATATPAGLNAFQVNPGLGFPFPGGQQQIDRDGATAGVQGTNLAYRLELVPEPATIGLLALAGLFLRRRRA